jgi:hypothetical protein
MNRLVLSTLALVASFYVAGCGGIDTPTGGRRPLALVESPRHPAMSGEYRTAFETQLRETLFGEDGGFVEGKGGAVLKWHATEVDKGSRALRYMVGMGAGRGVFRANASLVNPSGAVVGTTSINGSQTFGFVGGSYTDALSEAAEDLGNWANAHVSAVPAEPVRSRVTDW